MDNDKAFAKLRPTVKHTIRPGPPVAATSSISLIFIYLLLKASWTIKSIFSTCALAARSGTTPPNFLWISYWLDTIFDSILGTPEESS